jgi:ribose 5-phosphate isomerase B
MRIAVGSDHAGFEIKESLKEKLREGGHDVLDLGTDSAERVDYPEYAAKVGRAVDSGEAERGVLVCGSTSPAWARGSWTSTARGSS